MLCLAEPRVPPQFWSCVLVGLAQAAARRFPLFLLSPALCNISTRIQQPGVAELDRNIWKVPNPLERADVLGQEQAEPGKLGAVIRTHLQEQQHLQQAVFQEPGIAPDFPAVSLMLACSTPAAQLPSPQFKTRSSLLCVPTVFFFPPHSHLAVFLSANRR